MDAAWRVKQWLTEAPRGSQPESGNAGRWEEGGGGTERCENLEPVTLPLKSRTVYLVKSQSAPVPTRRNAPKIRCTASASCPSVYVCVNFLNFHHGCYFHNEGKHTTILNHV